MVATELSKEQMSSGKTLVEKLDEAQLAPEAAFWFYFSDTQTWKLVLAVTHLEKNGPKEVYRPIQRIIGKSPDEFPALSLEDVALTKPGAPIIELMRTIVRTGPGISGIRFRNNVIDGTVIEDAYIYRLN